MMPWPGALLLVISGPSGAGKSSLCAEVRRAYPDFRLSVSYTTRAPRGREQDGVDYHFVDMARFEAMIDGGAFVEHASVHGNRYGTARATIDGALSSGVPLLFDVDYQGARSLRAHYPDAVTVMVLPPSLDVLSTRLRQRATDSDEVIGRRMENARAEIAQAPEFSYVLLNDDLDRTWQALRSIVEAERCRSARVWPHVRDRFPIF